MDELQKRYEENPRRFFAPLANEYRKAGDLDQAIALCQEHLGDQPGNMNGQVVYGQALFDASRYDDAEATFETALTLDPENLIALRHLGDIARSKHDAPRALQWYKRVLDADPRNEEILAFIEELNADGAQAPTPSDPAAAPAPTDLSTPAADTVDAPAAVAAEVVPKGRPGVGTPTPFAPIVAVIKSEDPPKRQSLSLMDLSLDVGADAAPPEGAADGNAAGASGPPAGAAEFLDMAFDDAPDAPGGVGFTAPATAATPVEPPPPPGGDLVLDAGLGWEMGAVDLGMGTGDLGAASDESVLAPDTPQVFITETMAELYVQQGFHDEALQVYKQLAAMNPDDAALRDRVRNLESGDRPGMSFESVSDEISDFVPGTGSQTPSRHEGAAAGADESSDASDVQDVPDTVAVPDMPSIDSLAEPDSEPASADRTAADPAVVSARAFFASLAQRRAVRRNGTTPAASAPAVPVVESAPTFTSAGGSIDGLFGTPAAADDDAIGLALATAVATIDASAPVRGNPTQAAVSELTLDSVFRSESSTRTSGPVTRQSEVLNFDQFFASEEPGAPTAPAPDSAGTPSATPSPAQSPAPADDAKFQSWLQGLKGQ